jgi:hypothetical protein
MPFSRVLTRILLLCLLSTLSACLPTIETDLPAPLATNTSSPTEKENPVEAPPINTPTSAPESGCAIPPGSPPIPDLSTSFGWAPELQEYLNAGGLVEPLSDILESTPAPDSMNAKVFHRDLTGDGLEDLAITLYETDASQTQLSGSLLIFRCDKDRYQLAHSTTPAQNFGPPVLITVQDLNGDGIVEMFYTRQSCGAHTCFEQVEVLRWERSRFVNIFEGRSDDLPSPSIRVSGPVSDGSYQIEITAQGIASVGAGPYRPITRIWQWSLERSRFIPIDEQLAPPAYRIHLLHDADDATSAGNLEAALVMYQRVREDGTLDDWIKGDEGFLQLAAFATYRQITLYIHLGRPEQAQQGLQFLQESIQEGSPAYGFRLLAEAYWDTYLETDDEQAACSSAQRQAQQQFAEVLEPLRYGYANRVYSPIDVCFPTQ